MNEEIETPVADEAEVTEYVIPTELGPEWDEVRYDAPATKIAGWEIAAMPGVLNPSEPTVQELAYHLLMAYKGNTHDATFGRHVPTGERGEDRKAKKVHGQDGRWFANAKDVTAAAKAWVKLHADLKVGGELPWVTKKSA